MNETCVNRRATPAAMTRQQIVPRLRQKRHDISYGEGCA